MVGTTPEDLLQQLCRDLRLLWTQAGGPSLRTLAMRVGLGKSQLNAILNGKIRRPPDWDVIKSLVDRIRQYADDHDRRAELSLRTGVDEYWRPRYAVLEHAFRQPSPRRSLTERVSARAGPPQQLPAGITHFAGRSRELAALTGLLDRHAGNLGTVVISTIGGTAGVGKTALAVHWAHQVRDRFPDGQLYVNLRGFDPADAVLEPAAAIRRLLEELAVSAQRFPSDLDALAALYRSKLAGRRMLIVLDNARDSSQVRPLLPGAGECLVLVTSRNQLSGLVSSHGTHAVTLDLLSVDEARELLGQRIGSDRLLAEPDAVDDIIDSCARLPLALSIVAARAATHPQLPLRALANELAETDDRLNALTTDDPATDARAVFSWSYHALTPDAARLFRLLGLHPGPDFTAPAAASLAALGLPRTRTLLAELTRANLLTEHITDRYTFHDLLRAYAAEQAHIVDSDDRRDAAVHRMLDHYLHTGQTAGGLLHAKTPQPLPPVRAGVTLIELADSKHALDWFATEHAVLLAVLNHAINGEFDTFVSRMASYVDTFLFRQGYWYDQVTIQHAAITAARRMGDREPEMAGHINLASAYARLGRLDDARTHYLQGLDLSIQLGNKPAQVAVECNLGGLCELQGRYHEALEHVQRAAHLCEAIGDRQWLGRALIGVAEVRIQLGDQELALTACQRALALQLETDDRMGLARTWHCIGHAHYCLGQHLQAGEDYRRALELYREVGFRYEEADALDRIGDTYHMLGDHGAAREAWRDALIVLGQLDHADASQVRAKLAAVDSELCERRRAEPK